MPKSIKPSLTNVKEELDKTRDLYYKNSVNFDCLIMPISLAIIGYIDHKNLTNFCIFKIVFMLLFITIFLSCVSYLLLHISLDKTIFKLNLYIKNNKYKIENDEYFDNKSGNVIWILSILSFIISTILLGFGLWFCNK
jgi:multisubunit Na+/H+ antiporter MnhG subunit